MLHVDDDPQWVDLVETEVERRDDRITVLTETAPDDGLDRLESQPVDCVVSDYQMPGTDGLEFLEAVRGEYPNLPFVLFTGKGSEDIASRAIDAGASSYLRKDAAGVYELLVNRVRTLVRRQRSERRARIARDRLLKLYEQTDGFYAVDEDWAVTYWNERMEARTGYSPDAVTGERLWDVFPERTDTEFAVECRRAMERDERVAFETRCDPEDRWLDVEVQPVEDGLFVHSRDVTDEKEHERELQYRNKLLESFASTVSHDLRNPLNVAEGKLRLAQETGDFEHLEEVAQAHNRMRNLIDELLHFARGDELERSELSLEGVATRAWDTVTSGEGDLRVEEDAAFEGYDSQLRRLFENLFWNALDHGDATTVRVGALDEGFYVEDDGTGVPEPHREKVFESGFSTDGESPGYGLSIVESVVDIHDWEIAVAAGEDGGARFEVTGVDLER